MSLEILKSVFESNIFVMAFGFLFSLYISINNDLNDKKGVSNFILGYYFTVLIYILFSYYDEVEYSAFAPFLILLFYHFSKSISLSVFCQDEIKLNLSNFEVVVYYYFETLFISKIYITYTYSLLILFFNDILIITLLFLVIQLLAQISNNFQVNDFTVIYNKVFDRKSIINVDNYDIHSNLTFLLFMEDRDFLLRKGFVFSPIYVVIRKFLTHRDGEEVYGKEFEILSRGIFKSKFSKSLRFDVFYHFLKFLHIKIKEYRFIGFKNYVRGFSSIPQQLVRVNALTKDGTYNKFIIRRKIFIEYFYTFFFYKSIKNINRKRIKYHPSDNMNKDDKNEMKKATLALTKIEILTGYYSSILKNPSSKGELIDSMLFNAKTGKSRDQLDSKFDSMFEEVISHYLYNLIHWDLFNYIDNELDLKKLHTH